MTDPSQPYKTPYADLLPPLSTVEYEALRFDIETNGQRVPILVTPDGDVIDGHHRLRVCIELGQAPETREVDPEHPKALALTMNVNRRHMSPEQKAEVRAKLQATALELLEAGQTQEQVAGLLGVAQRTIGHWMDSNSNIAKANRPDQRVSIPPRARPEIVERVESGESHAQIAADFGVSRGRVTQIVNAAKADRAEKEARQAVIDDVQADSEGQDWKLLHGDFRERLLELPEASVDIIVTDPPYPAEFVPLLSDMSKIAATILKPQGILVCLTGQIFLPEVMNRLSEHLAYGWVYVEQMTGSNSRIMGRHVLQSWKPWVALSNGPWPSGRVDFHPDVLDASKRMKGRYRWEQSPGPAQMLIDTFTEEGDVVVDPFAGTGTYGVAALSMGRSFIGCEMDQERFTAACERLHNAENQQHGADDE